MKTNDFPCRSVNSLRLRRGKPRHARIRYFRHDDELLYWKLYSVMDIAHAIHTLLKSSHSQDNKKASQACDEERSNVSFQE